MFGLGSASPHPPPPTQSCFVLFVLFFFCFTYRRRGGNVNPNTTTPEPTTRHAPRFGRLSMTPRRSLPLSLRLPRSNRCAKKKGLFGLGRREHAGMPAWCFWVRPFRRPCKFSRTARQGTHLRSSSRQIDLLCAVANVVSCGPRAVFRSKAPLVVPCVKVNRGPAPRAVPPAPAVLPLSLGFGSGRAGRPGGGPPGIRPRDRSFACTRGGTNGGGHVEQGSGRPTGPGFSQRVLC